MSCWVSRWLLSDAADSCLSQIWHLTLTEADTVFTICVINKCSDYTIPFKKKLEEEGFNPLINGKTNVGLGRPLA